MILCNKLKNGLCKIVTKLNVTKSRLHCRYFFDVGLKYQFRKNFRHKKSGELFNTLCKSSRKIGKLENYIWHDMCRKLRAVNCDVKSMRLLWWSRLARCAISPRLKKVKVPRLNEVFKVFHTTNEAEGGHNGVKDILNLYCFL